MNIMIVDDSRTIRNILRNILEKAGYNVCPAEDGLDALEKLEVFDPNIIITDLNMPRMDGLEFVKKLRSGPKTQYVPILFLTTEGNSEVRNKGRESGATGWLLKPFTADRLLETIERVLP
ncbi:MULTISPECIES: response regulator [Gluconobacter]|uniref:response regulator n=1 Tax=Gluconobacter TaxID=441 RepID=UPI000A370DF4|nr:MULTISPECIES: response regulator [Gluconobacter]MBS1037665.1 response regulator [Gluconobacter cerinus]OUJ08144.1 chemotaxis protein CheY [Gluconobacter sp. DsW_058]